MNPSNPSNSSTSKLHNLTATELIRRFGVASAASAVSPSLHPFQVMVYGHVVAQYSNLPCAEDTANNEIDRIVADIHKNGIPHGFKQTVREQATDAVRIIDRTNGLKRVYKLSPGRLWNLSFKESTLRLK